MDDARVGGAAEHDLFARERQELACAFRWAARYDLHEGVANHFSLRVADADPASGRGPLFLLNPDGRHFSRMCASDLLLLDADDASVMRRDNPPEPTAWGLHSAIQRLAPHARCVLHAHPIYSTALASLSDSTLPPIDQNTALFYGKVVIDEAYGGLAFESEGKRCASLLEDENVIAMVMGNHGVLTIGETVAQAFDRLYYFERAAQTYIQALQTGRPLRVLPHDVAAKTAQQSANLNPGEAHFRELFTILREEEPEFMA